jgi:hypothetical protein
MSPTSQDDRDVLIVMLLIGGGFALGIIALLAIAFVGV